MSDLTDFLLARLSEDEGAARQAGGGSWRANPVEPLPAGHPYAGLKRPGVATAWEVADPTRPGNRHSQTFLRVPNGVYGYDDVIGHVARHDPARILAECEAKRQIVEWHTEGHYCTDLGAMESWYLSDNPCPTVLALAQPYADHPDFREEWRV